MLREMSPRFSEIVSCSVDTLIRAGSFNHLAPLIWGKNGSVNQMRAAKETEKDGSLKKVCQEETSPKNRDAGRGQKNQPSLRSQHSVDSQTSDSLGKRRLSDEVYAKYQTQRYATGMVLPTAVDKQSCAPANPPAVSMVLKMVMPTGDDPQLRSGCELSSYTEERSLRSGACSPARLSVRQDEDSPVRSNPGKTESKSGKPNPGKSVRMSSMKGLSSESKMSSRISVHSPSSHSGN